MVSKVFEDLAIFLHHVFKCFEDKSKKKVFEKREMTVVNRKNVVCLQQIERRLLLQCVASVGENQRVKGGITEVWRERNCFGKFWLHQKFYDPRGKHTASFSSLYTTRISSLYPQVSRICKIFENILKKMGETPEPH